VNGPCSVARHLFTDIEAFPDAEFIVLPKIILAAGYIFFRLNLNVLQLALLTSIGLHEQRNLAELVLMRFHGLGHD
jgi:hypothetical protein